MQINRVWAMPNKNTFDIKPIKSLLERYIDKDSNQIVIDPFSNGETEYARYTNDLNPHVNASSHMDGLDYLKTFPDKFADIVLYDPPYSPRQVVECYKSFGKEITKKDTQSSWRRKHLDQISRILKPEGYCISFGWNSNGVGKKRNFIIEEILLVAHGGSHNDTLVTIDKKAGDIGD